MATPPPGFIVDVTAVQTAMDIASASVAYAERQQRIDATLSSTVVESIVSEHGPQIATALLSSSGARHITLVYASTDALLRRIAGGTEDRVVSIQTNTLEEERKRQPKSKVLVQCDGSNSFCVTIATALPFALVPGAPPGTQNAILTQTLTCIKIPPALLAAAAAAALP